VNGPENLTVRYTKREIEGNEKPSDEENESGSVSEKRHEKTSEIQKPRFIRMGEDVFERHDRYPEHEKSDESYHIPRELVDDDETSENRDDRSENPSEIRPKNRCSDVRDDGTHSRACISGKHENSEKEEEPSDNRVAKFVTPGRSGFFRLFFGHEKNALQMREYTLIIGKNGKKQEKDLVGYLSRLVLSKNGYEYAPNRKIVAIRNIIHKNICKIPKISYYVVNYSLIK